MYWFNRPTTYEHITKDVFQLLTNKFIGLYDELRKKGTRTDLPETDTVSSELHKTLNDFFTTAPTVESSVSPSVAHMSEIHGAIKLVGQNVTDRVDRSLIQTRK